MSEISGLVAKFGGKMKILKLAPKRPHLGIFGLELENIIVIIEISALEFFLLQSVVQK